MDNQTKKIIDQAVKSSPIAAKAKKYLQQFQEAIKKEQDELLYNNKEIFEENIIDESGLAFAKRIARDLSKDSKSIKEFNERMRLSTTNGVPCTIKYNKMHEVLSGTSSLLFADNYKAIHTIAKGKLPTNYNNEITSLPILNTDHDGFWGSSKVSFLSCALWSMQWSLAKDNKRIQESTLRDSATIHGAALPSSLYLASDCRYNCKMSNGSYFAFIHSGYGFGAHRYKFTDKLNLFTNKAFAPYDCSSWIADTTACPSYFSTADQMATYNSLRKDSFVPKRWLDTATAKAMLKSYINVKPANLKAGDIYFKRKYSKVHTEKNSLGVGGHTGLVLGKQASKLITFEFNRDMPKREGFGVATISLKQEARLYLQRSINHQ